MAKEFIVPGKIVTGKGSIKEVGSYVDGFGKKALIVCDQITEKLGKVKIITDALNKKDISFAIYDDFLGEPTNVMIEDALSIYRNEACDFLVGIGGGSALDIMKAVAAMDANTGKISDYMGKEISGIRAKMVAIPTTAGTGSEATQFTIISDVDTGVKMLLKGAQLMPDVAIIDPELTMTLPPKMTASTGLDALTHAVEAYTSRKAQPLTDTLAISAIRRIFHYLPLAYHDNGSDVARTQMSIAALEAGMAFNNSSVTLVHGMSRPIGALFHVPHGISNAMLLSVCLEYAKEGAKDRFADMARAIGAATDEDSDEQASDNFMVEIKKICNVCHIPTLEGYGINRDEFYAQIDKMAEDAMISGSPSNTVRELDAEVLKDLYRKLYK
ncbi:MAG: iron-containing alcohol dehydrogenase [Butyrivibrio sp.]|uniref:iron-containing alcohol dehydrogenase n=1 Tax=Butyrivibrio sp. TaxID=28121 RepID=UPI001EB7981D|nr:iron-containing alcohol dehydrogenase [Butyrivibrio sp.]MBE5840658.1 iron-containing alcohol dehydrogenase [Butyrivibrio sp.]